jgi:hypothetical protein
MRPYNPPIQSFDGDTGFFGPGPSDNRRNISAGFGDSLFSNHSSTNSSSRPAFSFPPSMSSPVVSSPIQTPIPEQPALIPGSAICANVDVVYLFSSNPYHFPIESISDGDTKKCVIHFHLNRAKRRELGMPDVHGIDITFSLHQKIDGCRVGHSISMSAYPYIACPEDHDALKLHTFEILAAMEQSGYYISPSKLFSFLKDGIHRLVYDYSKRSTGVVLVKYIDQGARVVRSGSNQRDSSSNDADREMA